MSGESSTSKRVGELVYSSTISALQLLLPVIDFLAGSARYDYPIRVFSRERCVFTSLWSIFISLVSNARSSTSRSVISKMRDLKVRRRNAKFLCSARSILIFTPIFHSLQSDCRTPHLAHLALAQPLVLAVPHVYL